MIEKITFRLFLVCLVSCASLFLYFIWRGGPDSELPETVFKINATLFVVGLGSFLIWLSAFLYRLREQFKKE